MNKGFTLVELAIVIVVIGILATAVVGGQSIMESAEKRAFVTEMQGYYTALKAFELEFDAIPGDFDEAEEYWGWNCNGKFGSCNGDGDNKVEWSRESANFWVHLEEAGLIDERLGYENLRYYRKMDYFRKDVNGAIYAKTGGTGIFSTLVASHKLHIIFSRYYLTGINVPVLKANEAHYVDKKMDDGRSNLGTIVSRGGSYGDGPCNVGSNYNVSNDGISCVMAFKMD